MSTYSIHPDDLPIQVQDRRKRGYFTLDNILLDAYGKKLKAHGIAVYCALARFANQDQECWPSRRAIHERTGVSLPQINRELNKLVALNLITITPQFNEAGDQTSNLYTLLDIVDPLITQITPPLSMREPALIRQRTRTKPKKKDPSTSSNKKKSSEHRNYRPDEYKDIILG